MRQIKGAATGAMLAVWMHQAPATEIQNPYFHPPQTHAATPDATPVDKERIWAAASNDAFFNVGMMFSNGEGLSKDYVQAYKWFSLSAARGNEEAVKTRDKIALRMTSEQITEAQNLVSNASSPFCIFGICTTMEQTVKGNVEEAQRLLALGEERKRTEAVCAQFTDRMERDTCRVYGPDLGPDAALKQRRRSQNPYGSDPERCKYLEQVYFDCAHRNGASQCKVEDDARWACASQ